MGDYLNFQGTFCLPVQSWSFWIQIIINSRSPYLKICPHIFQKSRRHWQNYRCQKVDMMQVPYWESANIRCHHKNLVAQVTLYPGFVHLWLITIAWVATTFSQRYRFGAFCMIDCDYNLKPANPPAPNMCLNGKSVNSNLLTCCAKLSFVKG